jgi:glycosyltransferase involved in cell wall biosynthesis
VSAGKVILLLGRRDEPTDGVADYCEKLREAGLPRGLPFELVQLPWAKNGWGPALAELRRDAAGWRGRWVLLQYTTLAWSRRGFPLRAPRVLDALRQCGARPGVVFHDFSPLTGTGIVGHAREFCHLGVLRRLYARSELAIFTVPLNKISWLPQRRDKAAFIPVGANCPVAISAVPDDPRKAKTIAVYSVTGGDRMLAEVADLGSALRRASKSVGPVQLLLFGRGSQDAESALRSELAAAQVQIECLGLLPPEQISRTLARADVLLFVRGTISSRRSSAIAGIACGLPIVCYAGPETAWPITEAGILAVPLGDREALGGALDTVLSDEAFRRTLAERSRQAQEKFFSWAAITRRFEEELHLIGEVAPPDKALETGAVARIASGSRSTK